MYGSRLGELWKGTTITEVKAAWCEDLGDFDSETLRRALRLCTKTYPYPPTLPQFYALCYAQRGRLDEFVKLEAPRTAMPDYIRERLQDFCKRNSIPTTPRTTATTDDATSTPSKQMQ